MRKDEIEDLKKTVAERNHKIVRLERDLEVEKAKNAQLMLWLKDNGYNPGSNIGT